MHEKMRRRNKFKIRITKLCFHLTICTQSWQIWKKCERSNTNYIEQHREQNSLHQRKPQTEWKNYVKQSVKRSWRNEKGFLNDKIRFRDFNTKKTSRQNDKDILPGVKYNTTSQFSFYDAMPLPVISTLQIRRAHCFGDLSCRAKVYHLYTKWLLFRINQHDVFRF